jgi:hypothetical protein
MSALGHSRPGPAGRRSSHVRYAPKATVGHHNAIGRFGPKADIPAFAVFERHLTILKEYPRGACCCYSPALIAVNEH